MSDSTTSEPPEMTAKRFPIVLNSHTVMLIQLFTATDKLTDLWAWDYYDPIKEVGTAAEQLLDQLEDYWSPAFMMALRDATIRKLVEHDKQCGTNFAKEPSDG